jgi:membrane protein
MNRLQLTFYKSPPVQFVFRWARGIVFSGLNEASLYDIGKFFFREVRTVKLQERAAAVTYNFLMAMPPTFLFLFSLVPYLPLKNVEPIIFDTIKLLTPNHKIYVTVHGVVNDFMTKQHRGALSFGILLVLFFSSNGMMGLMRSFDKSLSLYKKRNGIQRRWTAIKLTIMLIGVSIITLGVLVIQNKKVNVYLLRIFHSILAVKILSFIILVLVIFIAMSIIYTYGPSLTHRFRFVSAGSVLATIASIIATSIFFFLVNNFLNYNKVYGSIGTLIAFMVWVWLNTTIILLGYELNVSILLGKLSREEIDDEDE